MFQFINPKAVICAAFITSTFISQENFFKDSIIVITLAIIISFLSIVLVFIISIVALILLLDTFKSSVNLMMPNIEFVLDNLYETIRDILLFIQDLI